MCPRAHAVRSTLCSSSRLACTRFGGLVWPQPLFMRCCICQPPILSCNVEAHSPQPHASRSHCLALTARSCRRAEARWASPSHLQRRRSAVVGRKQGALLCCFFGLHPPSPPPCNMCMYMCLRSGRLAGCTATHTSNQRACWPRDLPAGHTPFPVRMCRDCAISKGDDGGGRTQLHAGVDLRLVLDPKWARGS